MRLAVISDSHANLHALDAVLDAIELEGVDAIWSLGDVVGYGPRPNECSRLVADRTTLALCGNHDLGVLGKIDVDFFSGDAARAALWTREVLDDDARRYLEGLSPSASLDGVGLFHGSPRDPVWDYVLSAAAARDALELSATALVLVGHSHVALALGLEGGRISGGVAPGGTEIDLGRGRWLLNPGSVGQPRDGDPRAAFLLLDLERRSASFRRIDYSIEETQEELRAAGLPEGLAARLPHGL